MAVEAENVNISPMTNQHRHSLQHKPSEFPQSSLRHTQSHRYDNEGKKKMKKAIVISPVILEDQEDGNEDKSTAKKIVPKLDQFTIENEARSSKSSKKSDKSIYAYENSGYGGNADKRSISSRAGSSRQPSLQSLDVVREQYCCYARRTKCERKLLIVVIIMTVVIIVLVVVLAIIASDRNSDFKSLLSDAFIT